MLACYRRFGTQYQSHLLKSSFPWSELPVGWHLATGCLVVTPLLGLTSRCLFSSEIYGLLVFSGALCNLRASLSSVRKSWVCFSYCLVLYAHIYCVQTFRTVDFVQPVMTPYLTSLLLEPQFSNLNRSKPASRQVETSNISGGLRLCQFCKLILSHTRKVLKSGAVEGWRRAGGPIMWEMKKYYLESRSKGISYMK